MKNDKAQKIRQTVCQILKLFGNSRDPYKIATLSGIDVIRSNDFIVLKGMYAILNDRTFILLNDNLPLH